MAAAGADIQELSVHYVATMCDKLKLHASKAACLKQRLLELYNAIKSNATLVETQKQTAAFTACLRRARSLMEQLCVPGSGYWMLGLSLHIKEEFLQLGKEIGACLGVSRPLIVLMLLVR